MTLSVLFFFQETITTGPFVMRSTCRKCHGHRILVHKPCLECAGKGKTVQRRKIIVPVPAGVEDGQTVRMPVGGREIFITFRVGLLLWGDKSPLLCVVFQFVPASKNWF